VKAVGWDTLPKNFRKAVLVARNLGVQYLWIDSLCIIQDDTDDWTRESANMCSIYTHSYTTIAATKLWPVQVAASPQLHPTTKTIEYH
jgi:hypothetical protein